jgi:hypothetical protein
VGDCVHDAEQKDLDACGYADATTGRLHGHRTMRA